MELSEVGKTYETYRSIPRPAGRPFRGIPATSENSILVYYQTRAGLKALNGPKDRITAGELVSGSILEFFAVDISSHPLSFDFEVARSDGVGKFLIEVGCNCRVAEGMFTVIVRDRTVDAAAALRSTILAKLRAVVRELSSENVSNAEKAAEQAMSAVSATGFHPCFEVTQVEISIRLDSDAEEHLSKLRTAARKLVEDQEAAKHDRARAEFRAKEDRLLEELAQQRLKLDADRVKIEAALKKQREDLDYEREHLHNQHKLTAEAKLDIKRLQFEHERQAEQAKLDKQRLEIALSNAELEARLAKINLQARLARQTFEAEQLASLLDRGDWFRVALELQEDPSRIENINAHLAEQRNVDSERQIAALRILIESRSLEGWQVSDQAKEVLHRLLDNWASSDTRVGQAKQPQSIAAGAAGIASSGDGATGVKPNPEDGGFSSASPGDSE
jgi:hypothetical protein